MAVNPIFSILIIEDEASHRKALEDHLTRKGFRVQTVGDGETALRLMRENPPDLIVLDLLLPHLHGLDVLEMLRKSQQTAATPVFILTAYDIPDYRARAEALGVDGYLIKTQWKLTDFVDKIVEVAEKLASK